MRRYAGQSRPSRGCLVDPVFKDNAPCTAPPLRLARVVSCLQKHARVVQLLELHDHDPGATSCDHSSALEALRREVATIWETDQIRRVKPTPQVRPLLGYLFPLACPATLAYSLAAALLTCVLCCLLAD